MTLNAFVSILVFIAIGVVVCWCTTGRRTNRWRTEAHKMAEAADLNLPSNIEPLVMRYLRNRWAVTLPVGFGLVVVITYALRTGPKAGLTAGGVVLGLAAIPALFAISGVLPSFFVHWRAQGSQRLAHLQRLTLRDVTTTRERWALVVAVVAACVTAVIGFEHLAPHSGWAWVAPLVLLLAGASSYWYARMILFGRSAGSDALELAWDDVLRIRKVREALMSVAIMLPAELFLVGALRLLQPVPPYANGSHPGLSELLFALSFLIGAGIYVSALRENRVAYRSWRRLWPQVPPTSSAGAAG